MATLRALTTFHANGRLIEDGEEIDAADPIVKGREALFSAPEPQAPAPRKATARKAAAKAED